MVWQKSNHIGERFGRLKVLARGPAKRGHVYWECLCDCGTKKLVVYTSLSSGDTASCGCLHREKTSALGRLRKGIARTHGQSKSRAYRVFIEMWRRCTNPRRNSFENYGGRGISVCERWKSFELFFADMGQPPEGRSIDRIDSNGNYEPSNCRWATAATQSANRRTNTFIQLFGERMTVSEAARKFGVNRGTLRDRLLSGVPPELAIAPVKRRLK